MLVTETLMENKAQMKVESPFHFIELRLSKYISKRGWLAIAWKQAKKTAESLFHFHIFIELLLSKKMTKRTRLAWAVKTIQNNSWKCFSFSLNCDFQKKVWKQRKNYIWKSFSFHWVATFKICQQKGSACFFFKQAKVTAESPFHFIELRLSKKITEARLAWAVKTNSKLQLKVLFIFIELRLSEN